MPALKLTDFTCTITWLGRVTDRDAALESQPSDSLRAGFDGPEGEFHGGINRPSCSRVMHLHPRIALGGLRLRQPPCCGQRAQFLDLRGGDPPRRGIDVRDDACQGGEIVLAVGGFRRIRHTCTLPLTSDIHPGRTGPEHTLCTPQK